MEKLSPRIAKWLENWLLEHRVPTSSHQLTRLAGDGSTRTFYRVSWPGNSKILLSDPEWISSKDYPAHQAYLAQCGLPVPAFLAWDETAGALLMDDLGDELLQFRLQSDPAKKMPWLIRTAELLADLHGKTFPVPKDLPVSTRRFDTEKYFQELLFTQEHLVEKFLGLAPLSDSGKKALQTFCQAIAAIGPDVFAHRDYHTRNVLVQGDTLWLIDFQDARLGSPHYDVASLLYDPYVALSQPEQQKLFAAYQQRLSKFPKLYEKMSWGTWERDLERVAYQRVVKAMGSFASFFTRYGKKTHLIYLMPALEIAARLEKARPEIQLGAVFALENWREKIAQALK